MSQQRTLLDGNTGQKFSSLELEVGSALAAPGRAISDGNATTQIVPAGVETPITPELNVPAPGAGILVAGCRVVVDDTLITSITLTCGPAPSVNVPVVPGNTDYYLSTSILLSAPGAFNARIETAGTDDNTNVDGAVIYFIPLQPAP